jgi:hypothetical protein
MKTVREILISSVVLLVAIILSGFSLSEKLDTLKKDSADKAVSQTVVRNSLNSGSGKTLKMPYSTMALNFDYIGLVSGLDPNYFHWCISPIDDDQGKTHIFLSRWPKSLGMSGWSSQCELAHYVGNSAEGPFTFVNTVLKNSTMPSSWMVSPHNVRIKKIDGIYVIVYIMQDSRVGNQRGQKIGMLTSSSLNGPWTPVGPGGVVVSPSTDPSNWAYNGLLGVDNPDFDKVNGQYYIYFKSGPAMNGTMHYGYAVATSITGTYTINSSPQTDNSDYLEDATAFMWNGYEYLLTTDNFGTQTGIFGAGILWRADSQNSPGPFHMANAQIGFGVLSDYTTIPANATFNYTSWDKFERPAILMRNGIPAYFYGANSCNVSGSNVTCEYVLKCNVDQAPPAVALDRTGWTATRPIQPNPGGGTTPQNGSTYHLICQKSGLALDNQGSTTTGTSTTQWPNTAGNANQEWKLVDVGGGWYNLVCQKSGMALDNGGSTTDGTACTQYTVQGGNINQYWKFVSVDGGYYNIICQKSNKSLDNAASTTTGTNVKQWTINGVNSNQYWSLQFIR